MRHMGNRCLALVLMVLSFATAAAPLVRSQHGMVASQDALATKVGVAILQQGGNAIDAAVAVGYTLAVTLPYAGNLGGGGFMLVHLAQPHQTMAINYRERAPMRAYASMFLDKTGQVDRNKALNSYWSSGVPGTVAGLNLAHAKYGKLPLKTLIEPAIALAEDGFIVNLALAKRFAAQRDKLYRSKAARAIFFKKDGQIMQAGDRLVQKDLAATLRLIADKGTQAFYNGPIAKKIVTDMAAHDGLITQDDLANYQAAVLVPLRGVFRGYQVYSMPLPSSGGVGVIGLLNILSQVAIDKMGHNSARTIHWMSEAMNLVYADRAHYLGDPNFTKAPITMLLSNAYADKQRARIDARQHRNVSDIAPSRHWQVDNHQTTHFSVVDKDNNLVSNTTTLNLSFGSGQVVAGAGILLNNEMDDFSAKPGEPNTFGLIGGQANAIAPGKQPLSSMTPTIILDNRGNPLLATGTPGGSRIITTVLQVLLNVLVYEQDIAQAGANLRFHSQWLPDELRLEPGFDAQTIAELEHMGHRVVVKPAMGSVQSVMIKKGMYYGASDPRTVGLALGY